jgi:hypothetical protein
MTNRKKKQLQQEDLQSKAPITAHHQDTKAEITAHHQEEQEQVIVCVRCNGTWHVTEFDKVTDRNPMCVICSTIIGTNQ